MTKITKRSEKLHIPAEVERFKKQKAGEVVKNADGSITKRRETAKGSKELTTREGKLLETTTEFKKTQTNRRGTQTDSAFVDHSDMIGRRSTEKRVETSKANGDTAVRTETRDVFGIDKKVRETNTTRTRGQTTTTTMRLASQDSRGNAMKASDFTSVTDDGKSVTTRTGKRALGSELTTQSSTTWENGRFTLGDSADWQKTNSVDKGSLKETEYDVKPITDKVDKVTPWVGKIFKALGLEQEWQSAVSPDRMKETTLVQGDHGSIASRVGISGGQRFAVNADGLQASYNREALAGVYAEASDHVSGRYGDASYQATAKAEARASVDAQGRIDSNGLDATVTARAGVSVEAEVTGHANSQSVTLGGVPMNAAVDGRAKVTAEAVAEATGTVAIKRNPPTAIARGTAGASAVAKAEAEVKLSAGPFSVVGNAYASAGAEARASGVIGYEDGKLKLGGSVGAALGLGAGAGVTVEVDVRQIGEAAKGLADVNHDGKLDYRDVGAAAHKVADVAHHAVDTVHESARKVARWFGF
jgi:hypothetical protein